MKNIRYFVSVFIVSIVLSGNPAHAQGGVVTGLVLDEVLKGFTTRIQNIVAQAGDEARATAQVAAGEVNVLVANIAFAYKDALQTTIKETDRTLTDQLQKVDSVLTKLESNLKQDVSDTLDKVQQITLTLPFTDKEPQVTKQSPRIVSIANDQIVLKLDGIFIHAKDSGFAPFATINGQRIESSATTNRVMFVLKKEHLSSATDKMVLNNIQVTVPYKPGCWYCFFGKKEAAYNLLLGVLPAKAGKLEISATRPVPRTTERTLTSSTVGLSSQDCCDRRGPVCDPSPIPPGWSYVDGSAQMIELNEIGGSRKYSDWDEKGPRIGTNVCWWVETYQHNHGTDGNVSFKLQYRIRQTLDQDETVRLASLDLNWGDSRVVQLPDRVGTWIARYTLFDSKKVFEMSGPGKTDPAFVDIRRPSTGVLQITVAPPPDF